MNDFLSTKRVPNWIAIVLTIISIVAVTANLFGGNTKQIEQNKDDIAKMEILLDKISIDTAVISAWVQDQKDNAKKN